MELETSYKQNRDGNELMGKEDFKYLESMLNKLLDRQNQIAQGLLAMGHLPFRCCGYVFKTSKEHYEHHQGSHPDKPLNLSPFNQNLWEEDGLEK